MVGVYNQQEKSRLLGGKLVTAALSFLTLLLVLKLTFKTRTCLCLSGVLLGEIVKNLTKIDKDPKNQLKLMMLSAVSKLIKLNFSLVLCLQTKFLCINAENLFTLSSKSLQNSNCFPVCQLLPLMC